MARPLDTPPSLKRRTKHTHQTNQLMKNNEDFLVSYCRNFADSRGKVTTTFSPTMDSEQEVRRAQQVQHGGSGGGVVRLWSELPTEMRDLTVGGGSFGQFGGRLVGSNVLLTDPASVRPGGNLSGLGATVLRGVRADVPLPVGAGTVAAEQLAEGAAGSEQTETYLAPTLQPQRWFAGLWITEQLILQAPEAIGWVEAWLTSDIVAQVEKAAIDNILNTTGVASVVGGPNGAAPTLQNLIDHEAGVACDSAGAKTGFLTSETVRKKMRSTAAVAGLEARLWPLDTKDRLLGHPAVASTLVPSNLTKGSTGTGLSAIVFSGRWQELFIGWYGVGISFELVTDKDHGAKGELMLCGSAFADSAVRNPAAFSVQKDVVVV